MVKFVSDIESSLIRPARILRCEPDATLDAAFAKTKSSHDAVFVFDDDKVFLGMVSPSHSLFRKRYAYTTKVRSCLVSPPRITMDTPLPQIAEFMVATGIYVLPVFDGGAITGLVTARKILRAMLEDSAFFSEVVRNLKPERPVTAPHTVFLQKIYDVLRQKKVSRVVLVGKTGRVYGIVSRQDIQFVLTKPTTRQRIKTGGRGAARNYVFGVEKDSRLNRPAAPLAIRNVLAAEASSGKEQVVKTLVDSGKNSVVLVDKENRPAGIISTRMVLQAIASLKPDARVPVTVNNSAGLSRADVDRIALLAAACAEKLSKRSSVQRAEMSVREARTPSGKPAEFEVALHILFFSGKTLLAAVKNRDLEQAVREAAKRVEKQERRSERRR